MGAAQRADQARALSRYRDHLEALVEDRTRALKESEGKNILTDGGGELVHALIANDLVDELHLLVYPVVLGGGKRVFPDGVHKRFVLKEAKPYNSGVVGLHYTRG